MAVTLTPVVTYKRLVAAANDDIYYEDINVAAGTMVELDTSGGAIDTSDQLVMFEAFQKVFVVNGANLKVADFINTKLTHTALTTPHAHGDILTQAHGGSNNAFMVVDSTNAGKTATYGYTYYSGTSTSFETTTAISTSGSGTAFTPTDVADLINARLTHSALGTAHANGDILTQATTTATMTVDHTNAAKTATYGAVTSGTFNTANQVTGDGSGSAFTPSAVRLPTPHWYDYVVHPDDASGELPNKAYLGCNYRGRVVLSGNPEHPHQWYMSRQANPWDWAYIADDMQSPIKGGNSDLGELGDIIRCLIPYKDDYLIFGCATSIWFMSGDPYGGTLNELDLSIGIFGNTSWCFGADGLLYFWGTNGIYVTTIPGTPICLTAESLPAIVTSEAVDPSTHRISMAYDRKRNGILVTITLLVDGTNSNYWYSINTKGFFPETYPEECGPYSLFYYDANSETYRDLLVGCKDGYIRKFGSTTLSDDIGDTNELIDANVLLGPFMMSGGISDGKIQSMDIITAGGETDGTETDSDDIDYSVFVGRSAAKILEEVDAGSGARLTGTFTAPGLKKGKKVRRKVRGRLAAIELSNDTADESISFERLLINTAEAGRML